MASVSLNMQDPGKIKGYSNDLLGTIASAPLWKKLHDTNHKWYLITIIVMTVLTVCLMIAELCVNYKKYNIYGALGLPTGTFPEMPHVAEIVMTIRRVFMGVTCGIIILHILSSVMLTKTKIDALLALEPIRRVFNEDEADAVALLEISGSDSKPTDPKADQAPKADAKTAAKTRKGLNWSDLSKRAAIIAHRLQEAAEIKGHVDKNVFRQALVDLGVESKMIEIILAELPSEEMTLNEFGALISHEKMSLAEVFYDQRYNFVFFSLLIILAIAFLSGTGDSNDAKAIYVLVGAMAVVCLPLYFRGLTGAGSSALVAEFLSGKLEAALVKMMMTIPMVFLFGLIYYALLYRCRNPTSYCENHAIPICTSTGLPPINSTCPAQCRPNVDKVDEVLVCPDERIPGSRLEGAGKLRLASTWVGDRAALYAPTTAHSTSRCGEGGIGYLCSDMDMYIYSLPNTRLEDMDDYRSTLNLASTDHLVVASRGDFDCLGSYDVLDFPVTPSHNVGESVFNLCYRPSTGGSWSPVKTQKNGLVYVIVAPAATCTSGDCSHSDFTDTFRESRSFIDSMYFSMVIHSTIGFGDISPITQRGMILVAIQALITLLISYF